MVNKINIAPCVSVVLPVYNGEKYLSESIESILKQTLADFEIIIVDDASTDSSFKICQTFSLKDHRIILLKNQVNLGLIKTLNRAISIARGKYIARQDQDDISMPERFSMQVSYMEEHTEVGLLGTAYYRSNKKGEYLLRQPPLTDTAIRCHLLFGNIWCHASVMFRKDLLRTGEDFYNDYPNAEDYELWTRLTRVTKAATLKEPLVVYRVHNDGICGMFKEDATAMSIDISVDQIFSSIKGRLTKSIIRKLLIHYYHVSFNSNRVSIYAEIFNLFNMLMEFNEGASTHLLMIRRRWVLRLLSSMEFKQLASILYLMLLYISICHDFEFYFSLVFYYFPRKIRNLALHHRLVNPLCV